MSTQPDSIEVLRQVGLRPTPQRLAIVREVFSRRHPTVAEIYEAVRRQFPTIGLATVYNTLHSITERDLVRELPFANATRFDVNLEPHVNLVCTNCGEIEDSSDCNELIGAIVDRIATGETFAPTGQRVDIYGLCKACSSGNS
ncbi:MAG TPA: Fur family transcriptional regulator [Dehalococcoidia bacterium]|nr:Fur family transcriptional regulator [Dehalococcoidia bacterium]